MRNLSLFVASFILSFSAVAQTAAPRQSQTGSLKDISESSAVLEARIREIELQNKLDKALIERSTNEAALSRRSARSLSSEADTPMVLHVEGIKGNLEAVLQYPTGARQRVRVGDALLGAVVQKIALNDVVLFDTQARAQVRLQFYSPPAPQTAAGAIPPGLPLAPTPLPPR
jgi:type IV pilus biogenesis protein PilP